ncbi:WEE1 [Scenedesmus sp. PABB004]|nr:WEE1 [Scenedesmus sp. PABB004]
MEACRGRLQFVDRTGSSLMPHDGSSRSGADGGAGSSAAAAAAGAAAQQQPALQAQQQQQQSQQQQSQQQQQPSQHHLHHHPRQQRAQPAQAQQQQSLLPPRPVPPGLFSQPSQATQAPPGEPGLGSMRQPLDLRRINVAIANVQIRDDDMATSQETRPGPPALARGGSTSSRALTVEVVPRMPSQDMCGSFDYATPVEQQFQFDYDLSMQQDQRSRSPAASPVRHVTKRPRHAAGFEDGSEATSQPSQQQMAADEPCTSSVTNSGGTFSLPPVPSRVLSRPSRFGGHVRPQSPASFRNPFKTGVDGDQPHEFDSRSLKQCPTVSRLSAEFRQVREIGKGGFSVVFRGTHRLDGCEYALKRTKTPASDNKDRNAWLQEVQALAAVGAHPNIVQYYSAWAEPDMQGDQLWIQMELCGDSLAATTRLRDRQPWREPELVGLLKQMASALEHMHRRGIVHLDLKPDNIYCSREGHGEGFKLGDFGLATLRGGHWRVQEGDSRYLPLELLNNDTKHLDKADVFALGLTLYELSTGKALPANGRRYQELREGKIPMLPTYSNSFQKLLAGMLAADPGKRPSAEDVLRLVSKAASKSGLALAAAGGSARRSL